MHQVELTGFRLVLLASNPPRDPATILPRLENTKSTWNAAPPTTSRATSIAATIVPSSRPRTTCPSVRRRATSQATSEAQDEGRDGAHPVAETLGISLSLDGFRGPEHSDNENQNEHSERLDAQRQERHSSDPHSRVLRAWE
jgi:hypothetical protein